MNEDGLDIRIDLSECPTNSSVASIGSNLRHLDFGNQMFSASYEDQAFVVVFTILSSRTDVARNRWWNALVERHVVSVGENVCNISQLAAGDDGEGLLRGLLRELICLSRICRQRTKEKFVSRSNIMLCG